MNAPSILVIDDSLVVRKIVETCLRRAGYQVASFADPVPALRALFEARETAPPDLLIVDIGLPHLDGFDVIRLIRSNEAYRQIPIIVLSRRDGVLDRLKARLSGASAYITKPFKTQELTSTVRHLLPS
jgi:DNA-binding response OmpR family regulator